jgi:hypothetical protein
MTLPSQVFRRVRAAGWLILAGSIPGPEVGAGWIEQLLGHADLSKPVFWLETDVDTVEASEFLNEIEELIEAPIDPTPINRAGWENAGLLLLPGRGKATGWVTPGTTVRLLACLQTGGTLAALGSPAAAFGEVLPEAAGALSPGLGWLPGSVILTEDGPTVQDPAIRNWLRGPEKRYALRLAEASVLALGPEREVQVWGDPPPRLTLGSAWSRE